MHTILSACHELAHPTDATQPPIVLSRLRPSNIFLDPTLTKVTVRSFDGWVNARINVLRIGAHISYADPESYLATDKPALVLRLGCIFYQILKGRLPLINTAEYKDHFPDIDEDRELNVLIRHMCSHYRGSRISLCNALDILTRILNAKLGIASQHVDKCINEALSQHNPAVENSAAPNADDMRYIIQSVKEFYNDDFPKECIDLKLSIFAPKSVAPATQGEQAAAPSATAAMP